MGCCKRAGKGTPPFWGPQEKTNPFRRSLAPGHVVALAGPGHRAAQQRELRGGKVGGLEDDVGPSVRPSVHGLWVAQNSRGRDTQVLAVASVYPLDSWGERGGGRGWPFCCGGREEVEGGGGWGEGSGPTKNGSG